MLYPRTTTGVAPSRSSSGMNPRPSSGLFADQPERIRGHVRAVVAFRRGALLADVERRLAHERHVRKASRRRPPVEEVVIRHAQVAVARVSRAQRDDAVWVRERDAAKNDGIHEREDRAVCADAKRERHHGDDGHPSPLTSTRAAKRMSWRMAHVGCYVSSPTGRWAESITSTSTGPRCASSFRPSCS